MTAPPPPAGDPLAAFEPTIRQWFEDTFREPTPAQAQAWPLIARGEHVLVTAPTGSGKTLTAFLWSLNALASGRWQTGATRVLYVSPLKALNNDVRRNLLVPLEALTARGGMPDIRVQTRSGDTSAGDRQRMLRRPPEILITTPESLMLLLTSARGRVTLAGVKTVILDEIHALVDNRRGTLLLTALERLVDLAGEVQRIALSATVRPLPEIARYVAGRGTDGQARPMRLVEAPGDKSLQLTVCFPEAARTAAERGQKIWEPMAERFREHILRNRATLLFANSRRLAEKLTFRINDGRQNPIAYAHHGSLARDIRLAVEQRLKNGELKAIVATSSLEMGIDIGALDEVVLIQAPPSVAATLQRVGRSGHRVGEISRGALYPSHAMDFVCSAALTGAVAERDIEPLQPLRNPLDVLAQIIVSMAASESWAVSDILSTLRRSGPYETLSETQLDLVVEMLAGRYAGDRIRELNPRIRYDRIEGTVKALHGAVLAYYNAGGVIPDRGYFALRHADSGGVIGELDEEFVWEARVGQIFTLGTQNWQIHRITHNEVLVKPARAPASLPPFWRAETPNRSFHFSRRIGEFLHRADAALSTGGPEDLAAGLCREGGFEPAAAEELAGYLTRQRDETGAPLPHAGHVLVEQVLAGPGGYRSQGDLHQLIIHSFWGGRVNRPWGLALGAAMGAGADGDRPEIHADDNAVLITTRGPLDPDVVLRLVSPANLQALLRQALESSEFFGARFREAAGRALLVTRQRFNQRLPLWMSRLQSKKLLSAVSRFEDFPVLLETWRTCLVDEFDLPALRQCLAALEDGETAISTVRRQTPSPFAANLGFGQINRYMYADDTPETAGRSLLADELIRSAVDDAALRPALDRATVAAFVSKRQRTAPGYEPGDPDEWLEWIKERVLVPAADLEPDFEHPYLATVTLRDRTWHAHRERLSALVQTGLVDPGMVHGPIPDVAEATDAISLALEILSFYGPLTRTEIQRLLPRLPEGLLDDDGLVRGPLLADDPEMRLCERSALEALLRLQRALRRPDFEALPVAMLAPFVMHWNAPPKTANAGEPELPAAQVARLLEPLLGYAAPVRVWLEDIPACRVRGYRMEHLEDWLQDQGLVWQGCGREQIRIGYPEDLILAAEVGDAPRQDIGRLFTDQAARYGFLQLADRQSEPLSRFNQLWWTAVWRGEITADSLTPLRQALASNYRLSALEPGAAGPAHGRRRRGRRGVPRGPRYPGSHAAFGWQGNWMLSPQPEAGDPLADLEDAREWARMLLDRYGFICRELANREGGRFRWRGIFRALRVMELAGEVVAGLFFESLSGPQFALPEALRRLREPSTPAGCFWVSAMDPASPCGLGLRGAALPPRRSGNYLSFHAGDLALVVENHGKRLDFRVPPEHPELQGILAPVRHLLQQRRRLILTSINREPPAHSPYRPALEGIARFVIDHRQATLECR